MSYRCEVPGCRGNTPCPACLSDLSLSVIEGVKTWVKKYSNASTSAREVEALIRCIQKSVNEARAKTIKGKTSPPSKGKRK